METKSSSGIKDKRTVGKFIKPLLMTRVDH